MGVTLQIIHFNGMFLYKLFIYLLGHFRFMEIPSGLPYLQTHPTMMQNAAFFPRHISAYSGPEGG